MRNAPSTIIMASLLALATASPACIPTAAFAESANVAATEQHELVTQATFTAKRFADDPGISWVRRNVGTVKGIFIIPEQVKGAFMVGGAGGNGVMLARNQDGSWSYPAFYGTGSISFGFQAGGDVSEIVLLVMTEKGLNAFKNDSFKLGADISVTAGPVGAGAKAATADVLAFSRQKGLYGGVSIQGTVISARGEWNNAYYGQSVTPAQILFGKTVTNLDSDPLRQAVAALATPSQTSGMR
jgi:lipid-binding SYLF domain-containing protein